jgi:hypothetical protein
MTSNNPSLRELALAALARHRGTECGTVAGHAEYLSQGGPPWDSKKRVRPRAYPRCPAVPRPKGPGRGTPRAIWDSAWDSGGTATLISLRRRA